MSNELVAPWTCPECGSVGLECSTPDCKGIPEHGVFVGKLAPNALCRGWNGKRKKYCGWRAGQLTAHKGHGRCARHGGNTAVIHGRYVGERRGKSTRYAGIRHKRIRVLLAEFENDPDPFSVRAELSMARALLVEFVERYTEFRDALLAWYDSWRAANRPLHAGVVHNLETIIDELEALRVNPKLDEQDEDYLDNKVWQDRIARARETLEVLGQPNEGRPREVFDIADARHLIDTIVKTVDSIKRQDEATHIPRRDFFRVMGEMGNAVDFVITPESLRLALATNANDYEAVADLLKQGIKNAWLKISLPA